MSEPLERIRRGDREAFAALVRECWEPLVRYLTGSLGSARGPRAAAPDAAWDAAQDAAQEAFIRLWERRERWQGGSARALLFRIGRNAALDATRRAAVRARTPHDAIAISESPHRPDQVLAGDELERRLVRAIDELPARRREVFELIRFHGLSHAEAAEVMGISLQTVANQLGHALRELRSAVEDVLDAAPREGADPRRSEDG